MISVIVPIYNVERYINKCIDSIIHQSYKNLEIILVDDGSPDKCGEIIDEYSRIDKRIHVIHKSNGGLSSARNAGLDIALVILLVLLIVMIGLSLPCMKKCFHLWKRNNWTLLSAE